MRRERRHGVGGDGGRWTHGDGPRSTQGINFSVAAGRSNGMRGVLRVNDRWRCRALWFNKGVKIDLKQIQACWRPRVTGNRSGGGILRRDWSSWASVKELCLRMFLTRLMQGSWRSKGVVKKPGYSLKLAGKHRRKPSGLRCTETVNKGRSVGSP
ncbi:hypothetical protein NL676_021432 [Syzygium grande]|nr:hypothetical protein NL676_021432 [Syzygium grande]